MIIRIRSTGAVMYESEFRQYVKNTTGGTFDVLTPQIIASHDADPVLEGAQPVCGRYQVSVRNGVEQINGEWHTKYIAVDLSDEQKATKDADRAKFVRDDRNKRLADCDWTQLSDAPVDKTVWAVYRQSLRDITKQDGFPWTVSWPTTP